MELSLAEIAPYMRMGRNVPEGALAARVAELRDEALANAIRPARIWWRTSLPFHPESLTLARHLEGCRAAYLVCGTLGAGFDAMHRRVSAVSGADALILQAIGAAAIEKWMDSVEDEIRLELLPGETLRPRYSPGYGDFPLEVQREMVTVLDTARKIGVSLTDSLLMTPSKSVSAVIGVDPGAGTGTAL
jgi:hypothetical protein